VCTYAGLLCLLPVFVAISLAILWDDGRPIFFGQTRVGRNGRPFAIWKFRTMRVGVQGSAITAAGDRRITRVGDWLRALKLDELPQLFNVMKGDMSLIGPRPEVPEYVQLGSPMWQAVLQVRPGITDLATLIHRNEEQILGAFEDPNAAYRDSVLPAKLYLNLEYLHSRTFWRDLQLIFLTVRYSLFPKRFDLDHICNVFGIGARFNEGDYLHPLSCSLDR
jgi:lipopolysaccharide/colanic/teichoic acid biosynthesis glycosyltransferase